MPLNASRGEEETSCFVALATVETIAPEANSRIAQPHTTSLRQNPVRARLKLYPRNRFTIASNRERR